MKNYLITGTSTGIGLACAKILISHGCRVFGSVRKEEDGEAVQSELGDAFSPLLFDVTDHVAVRQAAVNVRNWLSTSGGYLSGIVNNAGIGVTGPVLHVSMERWKQQFEVNYFGPIAVIQAFLPLMGAGKDALPVSDKQTDPRRIVNISSVSGLVAYPFFGPYAGSKYALEALSDSLRRELLLYDIDVIAIEPGRIATPIWQKAEKRAALKEFSGTDYEPCLDRLHQLMTAEPDSSMLPVERVSDIVLKALFSKKPKTRYVIPDNPWLWRITNWLSDRGLDRLIGKSLGLKK